MEDPDNAVTDRLAIWIANVEPLTGEGKIRSSWNARLDARKVEVVPDPFLVEGVFKIDCIRSG